MKTTFFILIIMLAYAPGAISQACSSQAIQSPVSKKPVAPGIVSANCNAMVVKWQGSANQAYKVSATIRDAATGKVIKTAAPFAITKNNVDYTATIPVTAGTKVSWYVQGITRVGNRVFHSYPMHGSKGFMVPGCDKVAANPPDAAKENAVAAKDIKMQVKLYPNPVQSLLYVSLERKSNTLKNITIFDAHGQTLLTQRSMQNNIQVNVNRLVIGSYFIKITDADGKLLFTGKFIKQ